MANSGTIGPKGSNLLYWCNIERYNNIFVNNLIVVCDFGCGYNSQFNSNNSQQISFCVIIIYDPI